MAVTLQGLCRYGGRLQPQLFTYILFHLRWNVGKCTYRAAHLTELDISGCILKAIQIPFHLCIPKRALQSERCWFGMNAMGSPHHNGIFMLFGLFCQHIDNMPDILPKYVISLLQTIAVGG